MSDNVSIHEVDNLPLANEESKLHVTTMVMTYASDYDGLLTLGMITGRLEEVIRKHPKFKFKVVIAREDPDDQIQRIHYHIYFDVRKQLSFNPKTYFDIILPEPVVVLIKEDKTRDYRLKQDFMSELGADNYDEFEALVATWLKDNDEYVEVKTVTKAHPNFRLIQNFGGKEKSKYKMLRYVVKQNLVARSNFDVKKELKWLEKEQHRLREKKQELIDQSLFKELQVETVDELIELCKLYQKKLKVYAANSSRKVKAEFHLWLREKIEENLNLQQIKEEIRKIDEYWNLYISNYLNYDKVIKDYFRMQQIKKPTVHWEDKFYLKEKLYQQVKRIDEWVRDWYLKKPRQDRPKSLVVIGPSRIGKTRLFSTLGQFTYVCNTWNVDNWEENSPFSVFDDIDPVDEFKGHNFSWFKPFFGGQDVATVTDKYRAKRNIFVGKPLIWLSNIPLDESFKSCYAMNYINKNAEIIYLKDEKLYEKPETMEWIEGHQLYYEWKATDSWYYQNIVRKQTPTGRENSTSTQSVKEWTFVDETKDVIDDYEPLDVRQAKLKRSLSYDSAIEKFDDDKGRPPSKLRRKNSV